MTKNFTKNRVFKPPFLTMVLIAMGFPIDIPKNSLLFFNA